MWAAARAEAEGKMWSVRALVESAVEQGRRVLQHAQKRQVTLVPRQQTRAPDARHKLNKWQSEGGGGVGVQVAEFVGSQNGASVGSSSSLAASGVVSRLRPVTTRLVQGFVRKVSAPLWAEARRRATKRLVFGESAPYFALVGVTLVSGSQQGLVTKEDELESLCGNIREAISRAGWLHNPEFWANQKEGQEGDPFEVLEEEHVFSLADFELGSVIDKGCSAVVYAARWNLDTTEDNDPACPPTKRQKSESPLTPSKNGREAEEGDTSMSHEEEEAETPEELTVPKDSPKQVGSDRDRRADEDHSTSPSDISPDRKMRRVKFKESNDDNESLLKRSQPMSQGAVAKTSTEHLDKDSNTEDTVSLEKYPLAIKMMFNYEAESNAPAILRAMYKEMLPARSLQLDEAQIEWQERFCSKQLRLPTHHNIVDMPCVFVDRIPFLEDSMQLYPDALPMRLNPRGSGRNMSLFCVMKRYNMSLRDYVRRFEIPRRTSLLLLTQLLEAILHISKHNVAHRDLKSDNILLSLAEGWQYPHLVLTDFGCSVVTEDTSMTVPFPSREVDPRQGNSALMAPEVKTAIPGFLRPVNYSHADLWAVGALAYEMYAMENPFCHIHPSTGNKQQPLDSFNYKESQLPRLPKSVPPAVRHLIHDLLRRNPRNRPSANVAATLCQLILWAPSKWLSRHSLTLPSQTEIMQWLLCLTTKVLCEARLSGSHHRKQYSSREQQKRMEEMGVVTSDRQGGQLEYELVSTFLARVHYMDIIQAIKWNRAF